MRKYIFAVIAAVLAVLTVISLCGCEFVIKSDEAEALVIEYFDKLSADDIKGACRLMCAGRDTTVEEMTKYVEKLEEYNGFDFSDGATVTKFTGYTSVAYDSDHDGGFYRVNFELKVGEKTMTGQAELVKNITGLGIYNILILPTESAE